MRFEDVTTGEVEVICPDATLEEAAQLCADVFELPVVRPPQIEAAALGGAPGPLGSRWRGG